MARLADSPIAKAPAKERLTAVEARRIALAAQGFAQRRPTGRIGARQVRSAIEQVGLLQLDSVNVFSRSHYLPLFARLGPYPREVLDRLAAHTAGPIRREFFSTGGTKPPSYRSAFSLTCDGGWLVPAPTPGAAWSALLGTSQTWSSACTS